MLTLVLIVKERATEGGRPYKCDIYNYYKDYDIQWQRQNST